jgi:hypothetical protein
VRAEVLDGFTGVGYTVKETRNKYILMQEPDNKAIRLGYATFIQYEYKEYDIPRQ